MAVVEIGDEAVAYPLLILNFHESVNHTVDSEQDWKMSSALMPMIEQ